MPGFEWITTHWIESVAAIAGVVSVFLSARENIWSWPTALVNVSLYVYIFLRAGLYSDMGLQVVYFVLSLYGWYQWLYGGTQHSRLHVSRASGRVWLVATAVALILWMGLSRYTATLPGVSLPYLDAGLTTTSLVAQWMMTRKILENWILWIVADVVYVPMFIFKGLYPTAAQYSVFLALAVLGFVHWRRSWRADRAAGTA